MLPWFASLLLLLTYDLSFLQPADLEIDSDGRIWILSSIEPEVIRLTSHGERESVSLDLTGIPGGIAVSPTGRWAVSSPSTNQILVYDRNDIMVNEYSVDNPGDLVFCGMEIWVIDSAAGSVGILGGPVLARNCAGRDSRFSGSKNGSVFVWGSRGVHFIGQGQGQRLISPSGSACFTPSGYLLLHSGTLTDENGDTLSLVFQGELISSSPSGEITVTWGGATPELLVFE